MSDAPKDSGVGFLGENKFAAYFHRLILNELCGPWGRPLICDSVIDKVIKEREKYAKLNYR